MPIYQYQCQECGELSEFLMPAVANSRAVYCASCGSSNLEKKITAPGMVKAHNNASGTTCCGREEPCETSPCSTGEQCWRH